SYAPYTGFTMDWLAETQGGYLHISKCTDRSSRRSAQVASESNNNTQLQLSPNPAREALYLQMTGAKAGAALRLQLFDAQGRARALPTPLPATTTGTFQYRLDLDQLPTGWYFGRLQVGAHYETFRFLKVE
ncbi:MAG: T9SS type A sorting domain-containing protein, partial [Bacteroidota bacterium]